MKKLFIIAMFLLAYFSSALSTDVVQSMQIQNLINPYSQDNDFFNLIRVHEPLKQSDARDKLIQVAAQSQVNLMVLEIDTETQTQYSVYWFLSEVKYFERIETLFNIESFSIFNQTITTRIDTSNHTSKGISKKYSFHLFPLSHFKGDSSNQFIVFSDDEASIASFFSTLDSSRDFIYSSSTRSTLKPSSIRIVLISIFTNVSVFFAFSLVFLYIFYFVSRDRRNQAIQLLYGHTRFAYYFNFYKTVLKTLGLIFGLQFLLNYFFSIKTSPSISLQVLLIYALYFIVYAILIAILFIIISYALSGIQYYSYIHGYRGGNQLKTVLNLLKFTSTLILVLSMFNTTNALTQSYRLFRTIRHNESRAHNIYSFTINANYLDTIVAKNEDLLKTLSSEYDLLLLDNNQFNAKEHKNAAFLSKLIIVNPAFLHTQSLTLTDETPINPLLTEIVYLKKGDLRNDERFQALNNPLCDGESCLNSEVILLSDDTSIRFINTNPYEDLKYLDDDFILFVSGKPQFISSYFLHLESENEAHVVQSIIKSVLNENIIKVEKISNAWDVSLKLSSDELRRSAIALVESFLLVFLLTQTYYRVLFDRTRNEDAIRWLHGLSSFRKSYHSFFNQVLTSVLSVFVFRLLYQNSILSTDLMYLILCIILIEVFSLIIAERIFYHDLLKNIKERHL